MTSENSFVQSEGKDDPEINETSFVGGRGGEGRGRPEIYSIIQHPYVVVWTSELCLTMRSLSSRTST